MEEPIGAKCDERIAELTAVLILVLVEEPIGGCCRLRRQRLPIVLILVLVEEPIGARRAVTVRQDFLSS